MAADVDLWSHAYLTHIHTYRTHTRIHTSYVVYAMTRVVDCAVIRAIVTFAHGLSQSTASCGLPFSSSVTVRAQLPCLDENIIVGKSPCSNTTGPLMESGSKRTGAHAGVGRHTARRNDSTRRMSLGDQTPRSAGCTQSAIRCSHTITPLHEIATRRPRTRAHAHIRTHARTYPSTPRGSQRQSSCTRRATSRAQNPCTSASDSCCILRRCSFSYSMRANSSRKMLTSTSHSGRRSRGAFEGSLGGSFGGGGGGGGGGADGVCIASVARHASFWPNGLYATTCVCGRRIGLGVCVDSTCPGGTCSDGREAILGSACRNSLSRRSPLRRTLKDGDRSLDVMRPLLSRTSAQSVCSWSTITGRKSGCRDAGSAITACQTATRPVCPRVRGLRRCAQCERVRGTRLKGRRRFGGKHANHTRGRPVRRGASVVRAVDTAR